MTRRSFVAALAAVFAVPEGSSAEGFARGTLHLPQRSTMAVIRLDANEQRPWIAYQIEWYPKVVSRNKNH